MERILEAVFVIVAFCVTPVVITCFILWFLVSEAGARLSRWKHVITATFILTLLYFQLSAAMYAAEALDHWWTKALAMFIGAWVFMLLYAILLGVMGTTDAFNRFLSRKTA